MNSKEIILFVWDEEQHFENNISNLGKDSFKKIIRIDSLESFEYELNLLDKNSFIHLVVHIFFSDNIKGIQQFISSGIREKYPLLDTRFISDGTLKIVQVDVLEKEFSKEEEDYINERLQKYHKVRSSIENEEINIYNIQNHKSELMEELEEIDKVEYVIITALEQDEMEKVLPLITKIRTIDNKNHYLELGYFKSNPEKKVIYTSQNSTGMVDAAIIATELICRYSPKFVIMTGVMGGKPKDTSMGDVIISRKIFTIDKGKITKDGFEGEIEVVSTESAYITKIERAKNDIIDFIKKNDTIYNNSVKIHFEPIACVRSVINLEGFFEENIITQDRKTVGLEMESYGIARACKLVNNGETTPIIIKSVMDNTQQKTDAAKKLAAWTSAKTLEYIIANDII